MRALKRVVASLAAMTVLPIAHAQSTPVDVGKVLEEETRVFAGPCIFQAKRPDVPQTTQTPEEQAREAMAEKARGAHTFMATSALGGAVVAAVAETAIDFGVAALKAAAEEKTAQAVVAFPVNTWLYQMNATAQLVINPNANCIQIVSGSFWNGFSVKDESERETNAVEKLHARYDDEKVKADARSVYPAQDPAGDEVSVAHWKSEELIFKPLKRRYRQLRWVRFIMEVRVEQLEGTKDKFYLAPSAFYFQKPVQTSIWNLKSTRNILVTITLTPAGDGDANHVIGSIAMPFRDVEPRTLLSPLYFEGQTSRALQAPALEDGEKAAVEATQKLYAAAKQDVTIAKGPAPAKALPPINDVRDAEYLKSATQYCKVVEKYNAKIKKGNGEPITAPECPVEILVARSEVDDATTSFREATARRQATFNTDRLWLSGAGGIKCQAGLDKNSVWNPNCTLQGAPKSYRAITVSATVVEIKEPSKFVAFLGNVAEKVKPTLKTAVEASLPAGKAKTEEDQRKGKEDLESLKLDVAVAEASLASAKGDAEIAQARKTVYDKKVLANRKARETGLPEPYTLP